MKDESQGCHAVGAKGEAWGRSTTRGVKGGASPLELPARSLCEIGLATE